MTTVRDLVTALDSIAPFALAADWDNVGLLVGREDRVVTKAVLTIDLTKAVLDECVRVGAQAVVAYHPPIFRPLKRLAGATPTERLALSLAEADVAAISPHTALDAAEDGLTDWIARGIGTGDIRALTPAGELPETEETKIVTFCPVEHAERLRDALAAIGAGRIGAYERCSFETLGTGTFFAGAASSPTHGAKGQLERLREVRLEMVCPKRALALAAETVRQFHPYEEPPFEIHALLAKPRRGRGEGRRITLDEAVTAETLAERLKRLFGVESVAVALPEGAPSRHKTIGIVAGSGSSGVDVAIAEGCTLFVTGELSHHETLAALARGCGVIVAGHTNTERGFLPILATRLRERVPGVEFAVSAVDRDPFVRL